MAKHAQSKDSTDVEAVSCSKKSGAQISEAVVLPPDGGLHAWIIVMASFLTNGIIFGIHNCYGIIYLRLKTELEESGVSNAATKACKYNPSSSTRSFRSYPFPYPYDTCVNN